MEPTLWARDHNNATPLLMAAHGRHAGVVQFLVPRCTTVIKQNDHGRQTDH